MIQVALGCAESKKTCRAVHGTSRIKLRESKGGYQSKQKEHTKITSKISMLWDSKGAYQNSAKTHFLTPPLKKKTRSWPLDRSGTLDLPMPKATMKVLDIWKEELELCWFHLTMVEDISVGHHQPYCFFETIKSC